MTDRRQPLLPDGFRWSSTAGRTLACAALDPVAFHCFTTREVNLRGNGAQAQNAWEALAASLQVEAERLVRLKQIHGADVLRLTRGAGAPPDRAPADIVVTDDPSVALAVQVADCVPLLIVEPGTGVVAAAHAGWRGTAAGVARRAVEALATTFGTRPQELVAAIGPSIGPCCYTVGADVQIAMRTHGPQAETWFHPLELDPCEQIPAGHAPVRTGTRASAPPTARFNLWRANADQLVGAGVQPDHIHVAGLCTAGFPDLFFSYRREGAGTGRMVGVIRTRMS